MSEYEVRNKTSRILELLHERERNVSKTQTIRQFSLNKIAASAPWNIRRMQNMVLSVGPGTPASTTMVTTTSSSSTHSGSSSDTNFNATDMSASDSESDESRNDSNPLSLENVSQDLVPTADATSDAAAAAANNDDNGEDENQNQEEDGMEDTEGTPLSRRRQRQFSESSAESSTMGDPSNSNNLMLSDNEHSMTSRDYAIEMDEPTPPSSLNANTNVSSNTNTSSTSTITNAQNISNPSPTVNTSVSPLTYSSQRQREMPLVIKRPQAPDMKHGGCINTAAWLTCPWRLSTASTSDNGNHNSFIHSSSHSSNNENTRSTCPSNPNQSHKLRAISSKECPTQLVTSGDDRLIKFWDVSGALGTTSLCNAGRTTELPFSNTRFPSSTSSEQCPLHTMVANMKEWKQNLKRGKTLSGAVVPLATLLSGHRGNVFHVTPIPNQFGTVVSCAADGFLRLSNIERQLLPPFPTTVGQSRFGYHRGYYSGRTTPSQVIVSPEFDGDERQGLGALRSSMCYSHCFLNANTGLLCSERGLRRFDLRVPPMNQPIRHVFWDGDGGMNNKSSSGMREYARRSGITKTCKACAVWKGVGDAEEDEMDSYYIFAGGSSGEVALFDLRMDGPSRIIQKYQPKDLGEGAQVSVSGLDLSRDGRELLVSYENDQIYTFPIFPNAPRSGPTIDDLNDNFKTDDKPLPELASYGGHLNRFTFLKNAKYAGPNDEYICTGSDSGHAWIYERSTGSVASLLKADQSTCNGVIPHPTLPFFVTYGIDSTAKLWRATTPVDDDIDDSPSGRVKTHLNEPYEKSLVARHWRNTQNMILELNDFVEKGSSFLPDRIPTRSESDESFFRFCARRGGSLQDFLEGPYIANDSRHVSYILQRNSYACTRSIIAGEEKPIQSDIDKFSCRVGLIRLKNQADRLGLKSDPKIPWVMYPATRSINTKSSDECVIDHPADLVPDYPSDWIQFDSEMTSSPTECGMNFNKDRFNDFFCDLYKIKHNEEEDTEMIDNEQTKDSNTHIDDEINNEGKAMESASKCKNKGDKKENIETNNKVLNPQTAWKILLDTILLLKEGGNRALQAGFESLAARRYDKGLRYCAVAFLVFPCGNLKFLEDHQIELMNNSGFEIHWTPLLKALITIRLNLSLTMLKTSINDRRGSGDQAQFALEALQPFTQKKGFVLTGKKLDELKEEPIETFNEAKELQAKAFFRLGNAKNANMDYGCAFQSFEKSIQCKMDIDPNAKIEPILLRRLEEAKRNYLKKKKRQRKKFKGMFATEIKREDDARPQTG